MATRKELIGFLSNYLTSQATKPSWYYTASPAELETLYKDYIKSRDEYMDTVTPFYRAMGNDPTAVQMFQWFSAIANREKNAAGIIAEYEKNNPNPLSEEQKADLRTYEAEQEKRNQAKMEQYVNAEIYGLPTPDASGWDIPIEKLEGLRNVQKGGMTELASSERWQRDAQKKYAEAEMLAKLAVPVKTTTTEESTDPLAWLYNRTVGQILGDEIQETENRPVERNNEPTPKAIQDRNTAYVAMQASKQAVKQSSQFTERLANEIARQMEEKYGTPYEAAIVTARRLAEEEEEKKYERKANRGSSALSEWDKEQNRKRKLFEGRGI